MKITNREINDIAVIDFEGDLDTNTSPKAEKFINKIIDQNKKKILVNFKNLDYISSAGLRVLLGTMKMLHKMEGELKICDLNETVLEIFDISGFSTILSVCENEEIALGEF